MSGTQMTNLDIRCAELGRQLANVQDMKERILNEALTVLEEQGPYAVFLFIRGRHSNVSERVEEHSLKFLQEIFQSLRDNGKDILSAVSELSKNLDDLLFAHDLLRKAFSYARFQLKVKSGG